MGDDDDGATISQQLYVAASKGDVEATSLLILRNVGIDLNWKAISGWTALHIACFKNHLDICKLLIGAGASVSEKDNDDCTPIFIAAMNHNNEICNLLLSSGASFSAQNKDGFTPLHIAVRENDFELCATLIERGSEVNLPDREGRTPIFHVGASETESNEKLLLLMIRAGSDLELQDKSFTTPLGKFGFQRILNLICSRSSEDSKLIQASGPLLHTGNQQPFLLPINQG